jgi:hypothetical protein
MDWLSPNLTNSPSKKKPCTCQQIMIMEGGDEDMETNVITQRDDELIRIESDQFMEDRNEPNFEHVPNQKPLLVQETSTPTK